MGTHQVLAYSDYINLIGDYIRTIERNVDVLLKAFILVQLYTQDVLKTLKEEYEIKVI